jgi:hypothetical protein
LLVAAAIVAVANMVELLHLIGREDRGELLSGLLVNGSHLLLHNYRGDGVVVFQCGDFVVTVGNDGFELRVCSADKLSFLLSFAASRWGLWT